ncbi:MAG: serine/threonine-protein kinase [Acidobacteria bacterium]|nr:serine/threonine-protein kinase [Acidobacteriota bacterium]
MSDRIARLSAIYHAALEKPADVRDLFLREACGSDSGLRDEVASLLAQPESAAAFLSSPAFTMTTALPAGSMTGCHMGVYRLEALIGVGGMGEVYRARDTHLGRDVAIKVLPPALSTDPDRLARFDREARTLASVRHSHIGALFGIVEADNVRGLVLELIDGPTLADRLAIGPLPVDEALEVARQLADALEGAHELGIVHRDLKPANIKIRPDGVVKLIDFGLAKVDRDGHAGSLPSDVTTAGAILGTATYMSPEQARGDEVDRRTDIWAFGCIVYEMLTGRPAFPGRTLSDTIAAVLEREPDWTALSRATPPAVHELIARCLQKTPRQRLRDIGDARLELEAIQRGTPMVEPPASKGIVGRRAVGAGLGLGLAAMFAVALLMWTSRDAERQVSPSQVPARHLDLDLGPEASLGTSIGADVVISSDGSRLALVSGGRLMTRRLDRPDWLGSVALADTDGAYSPFFSPDGDWIAFFTVDALKKVRFDGGPVTVVSATTAGRGGSWDINDVITFAAGPFRELSQVPAAGGTLVPLTTFERDEITHRWPQVLPDAGAVIFTAHSSPTDFNGATIELITLPGRRRTTLVENAAFGRYIERADGRAFIAYFSGGALLAAPFDRTRMIIDGEPIALFDRVAYVGLTGFARIDFSRTGDTVFRQRLDERVHWIDAFGTTTPLLPGAGDFEAPALSHDGRRLAIRSGADVVVYDWERDAELRVATNSREPVWTPDDQHLVVSNNNGMAIVPADGSAPPRQLTSSKSLQIPSEFTSGGRELLFSSVDSSSGRSWDLWRLPMSANLQAGTPVPLLQTTAEERHPRVSPDGRWLAYMSTESRRLEVYVRRMPDVGRRWAVSTNGGRDPQWSSDGKTLFIRSADNHLLAVPYTVIGDVFRPGRPRAWTREPLADLVNNFTVGPDSRRVAALLPEGGAQQARSSRHLVMVLNPFDSIAGQ